MDALLIIFADSDSVLIPWDINLAQQFASVSEIKPYTDFGRNFLLAVKSTAEGKLDSEQGRKLLKELAGDSPVKDNYRGESIIDKRASETFINILDSSENKDKKNTGFQEIEESADDEAVKGHKTATAVLPEKISVSRKAVIEFSSSASYLFIKKAEKELYRFTVQCREEGADRFLESKRIIKTEIEIAYLKKAASITDRVFCKLEKYLKDYLDAAKSLEVAAELQKTTPPEEQKFSEKNAPEKVSFLTETDIALFIETEGRKEGAEGTGFETLAASPERSFSIHPFPSYSDKKAPAEGLTIIDFGHKYKGYTSDVTTTVACGNLTDKQEKMISLVQKAIEIFESILAPGISTADLTNAVTDLFKKNGFIMPHALGHGIGLDVHESPVLRNIKETETILKTGMVLAIEPGIYSPESGGVRLENDYLITESGFEKLTNSKLIRL